MPKAFLQMFALFFLFSCVLFSQIPNAGFENWTGGEPNGWITGNFPPFMTNVTQSPESYSGSSAIKLSIESYLGFPFFAYATSGDVQNNWAGFPVSQRYGSLRGYYKLVSSPNKILEIIVYLTKGENAIGSGFEVLSGDVPNYNEFVVPISYGTDEIPDTATIYISYIDTSENWTAGGGAYVDDLSFGGFVDVKEIANSQTPTSYELLQNYPNPFNPSTKIEYSIPEESFVELKVYNLIGQEIVTLVNEYQKAGTYRADFNAEGMQSGIYIAKLMANGFTQSVKMTLLK